MAAEKFYRPIVDLLLTEEWTQTAFLAGFHISRDMAYLLSVNPETQLATVISDGNKSISVRLEKDDLATLMNKIGMER